MSRQSSLSFIPPEAIKQVLTSVTAMSTAQLVAASSFGTGDDTLPLSHADNVLIAFSSLYPVIHRDVKLLICMDGEQRAEFRKTFGISFDPESEALHLSLPLCYSSLSKSKQSSIARFMSKCTDGAIPSTEISALPVITSKPTFAARYQERSAHSATSAAQEIRHAETNIRAEEVEKGTQSTSTVEKAALIRGNFGSKRTALQSGKYQSFDTEMNDAANPERISIPASEGRESGSIGVISSTHPPGAEASPLTPADDPGRYPVLHRNDCLSPSDEDHACTSTSLMPLDDTAFHANDDQGYQEDSAQFDWTGDDHYEQYDEGVMAEGENGMVDGVPGGDRGKRSETDMDGTVSLCPRPTAPPSPGPIHHESPTPIPDSAHRFVANAPNTSSRDPLSDNGQGVASPDDISGPRYICKRCTTLYAPCTGSSSLRHAESSTCQACHSAKKACTYEVVHKFYRRRRQAYSTAVTIGHELILSREHDDPEQNEEVKRVMVGLINYGRLHQLTRLEGEGPDRFDKHQNTLNDATTTNAASLTAKRGSMRAEVKTALRILRQTMIDIDSEALTHVRSGATTNTEKGANF